MPGSPAHLVTRFFDVVTARALTPSECEAVSSWLSPALLEAFFAQSAADQRHGYHAALSVVAAGVSSEEVIVAALVHDIAKRHARLGAVGRSVTSVCILLGLPLTERMRMYRDHGIIGARELGALGAPSLAIDFSLHHHRERPPTIDPATWETLIDADQPPKPSAMLGRRITSASE